MRKTLVMLVAAGACAIAAQAQPADPSLQSAIDRLTAAWAAHDAATWQTLVSPDFMIQHADGRVHVMLDEVEHVRSGGSELSPHVNPDERITFLSHSAVRVYTAESGRVTEIWQHAPDGRWQLLTHWEGFGKHPVLEGLVHV